MATVTGYTAARIQEIEDEAIISGTVSGNDLLLTKYNGTVVNAGNVRGPQGVQGPTGDVSLTQLNTAISGVQAELSSSGLGIVAKNTPPTARQTIVSGAYVSVNQCTVQFTPVPGRAYKFAGYLPISSPTVGANFIARIVPSPYTNDISTDISKGSVISDLAGWVHCIYLENVIIAPAGWNVQKSFVLQAFSTIANSIVHGDTLTDGAGYRPYIYVEDIGTL